MQADLYVPAGGGKHPGLLIVNGAVYQGRRYAPLVGAATAFARAGYVVMVPELGRLRQYIVDRAVVDDTIRAIQLLHRQPEVKPGPVGVYGFSVGGSFALMAAEDPAVARSIAFVADIAGYYRLTDIIQAVLTGTVPGSRRHVKLDPVVGLAIGKSIVSQLPVGSDRTLLENALQRSSPAHPLAGFNRLSPSQLTPPDRPLLELIQNRDPSRVPGLIAAQPPALRSLLQLSPALHLEDIRAPVWVLHDENDPLVPVEESRQLASDPRMHGKVHLFITTILRHTEFDLSKMTPGDLFGTYISNLRLLEQILEQTLARLD